MADLKLAFGATRSLPEGVHCAWGARLIWPNDLLHDRQGFAGETEEVSRLEGWLNRGPLREALAEAARLARSYELSAASEATVTLYEDEHGKIVGNPQASHGYLYVAAWLKKHAA